MASLEMASVLLDDWSLVDSVDCTIQHLDFLHFVVDVLVCPLPFIIMKWAMKFDHLSHSHQLA